MSLSIATNVASMAARRQVNSSTDSIADSFRKLSSGLRINTPGDDPAGLQMADALRADARLSSVAIRNANDGISQATIAQSALTEIGNILSRMGELAEQSSNGVFTNDQRSVLQVEFEALGSEIERITSVTLFNDRELISDNAGDIELQVGIDSTSNSQITLPGLSATLASLNLAPTSSSQLTYSLVSVNFGDEASAQLASLNALSAVRIAIDDLNISRGTIGATESRLNSAVSYLTVARENYIAAEGRIRDIDVAEEVANLVQAQVVQQAATAILAQANQQPATALSLLQ